MNGGATISGGNTLLSFGYPMDSSSRGKVRFFASRNFRTKSNCTDVFLEANDTRSGRI